MKLGIVGLPNVGKSTLFNSMTLGKAEAANYPFCTIDPNVGVVAVPDHRLDALTEMYHPKKTTPAVVEFVDIAGLVKGASKGQGLGNKFLANIRECDAIVHVVRCFDDENIMHVVADTSTNVPVDPAGDIGVIDIELIMADVEMVERRIDKAQKAAKGDKKYLREVEVFSALKDWLNDGNSARSFDCDEDDAAIIAAAELLSLKPIIYAANLDEEGFADCHANAYYKVVEELAANDWVAWSGTGALAATVGKALSGGADGSPASADYTDFLAAIEPYKFDVLIYDGADTTVQDAMVAFVKRLAAEEGAYTQLVAAGLTNPDDRFVVNIMSGVVLSDGTALTPQQVTWWAGGALAGAQYNESLTYAAYPNAVDVSPKLTNSGYIDALTAGQFVLFADDGVVKVEQDINSLVTYTTDITGPYHKNRVIRLLNTVANDIYQQFSDGYIGVVNNNEQGRMMFKSAIVGYLLDIQANNGIQNFEAEDVTVEPGEAIDAIVVNLAIQPVDSVEKIYVTITVN